MTPDPKEAIERAIDEALASVVSGEPRRVNAASVRKAMAENRSPRIPVWLAVAAVLVVGFAITVRERESSEKTPKAGTRLGEPRVASEPRAARSLEPMPVEGSAVRKTTSRPHVEVTPDGNYEGLPRLTIASIELPKPLSTSRLEADAIQTPPLEIAPLSVSSLSIEQEKQRNP